MRTTSFLVLMTIAALGSVEARERHVYSFEPFAIRIAIGFAQDGDTIIAHPGTYNESIDFKDKRITVRSLDPEDPAIVSATILNGDGVQPCVTIQRSGAMIAGLTLRNGGLGVRCYAYPALQQPLIINNVISPKHSGIVLSGQDPIIIGNTISGGDGPGISVSGSSPLIQQNTIALNVAAEQYYGGGISIRDSFPIILDNLISDNVGNDAGGGIHIHPGDSRSTPVISGNIIAGNSGFIGGGISGGRWGIVTNNVIADNRASYAGGGVYRGALLCGNVITSNSATWGGGVCAYYERLWNNTIVGNSAVVPHGYYDPMGGGVYCLSQDYDWEGIGVEIRNCILWGNRSPEGPQLAVRGGGGGPGPLRASIGSSIIEGGRDAVIVSPLADEFLWLDGNIDAEPGVIDLGHWHDNDTPNDESDDVFVAGDYRLLPGSPCIDSGGSLEDNAYTELIETLPATDIAGLPRIIDGNLDGTATVDIGAYEYLPGDVNYDGKVNVLDLLLVRNSMGRDPASSIQARKADVNADGAVNVQDLLVVRGQLNR